MEKIFILGYNKPYAELLGAEFIEIPNLKSDYEIHNSVRSLFDEHEIDKLIIEIGIDNLLALKIGYHIRLSLDILKDKSLIPIYFISTRSLSSLVINSGIWGHILSTKGIYFSSLDNLNNIKIELDVIEGISISEYKTKFLDIIKILPDEAIGRHSMANIWGAYSLDKAAHTNALQDSLAFAKRRTELYFKYISASKHISLFSLKQMGYIDVSAPNTIKANNRRILLIDDEADTGWEVVLKNIFETSTKDDFVIINEKVCDYGSLSAKSRDIIENESFDLFLIDLRLDGVSEESTMDPDKFSGMKVMKKIKSINPGNQVIVFSASNKVWNMKALLDAGADGYYMKESPEFGFSSEFSEQNYLRFKRDVESCFDNDFLKGVFKNLSEIKRHIATISNEDFKNQLLSQTDLFWNMIIKAKSQTDFAYSYITLYLFFEIINNHFYEHTSEGMWEMKGGNKLLNWQWSNDEKAYTNTSQQIVSNNPPEWLKIAGLYFQLWEQKDSQIVMYIYYLITKRNGFIHNSADILDKKDSKGNYINHDIYTKEGIKRLLQVVSVLIPLIKE